VSIVEKLLADLTTDAPLKEIVVGALWTAVVLDTTPPRCGLASSLVGRRHHEHKVPPVPSAGRLLEKSARELADGLRSSSELEASIGMAALNALLDIDETACDERNALDVILDRGAGRRVAIVGHFPFVDRVRSKARECQVLELEPGPTDEPAERAAEFLPSADVVAMTGTTLINHTFEGLIELCPPDTYVLLLGASTPLTPLLFDHGVDVVAGTRVIDVDAAVRAVSQGAAFPQIPGKRLLMTRETKGVN
jgi:uncharacterized protein (DUF4213/DUF364 family)